MSFEIGRTLETHEPFYLKVKDVVASRTYIASETRFGKSHTARRIIEKCFGQVGIIIIDPEGEYSSLREKYSFIIIGRDVPMEVETQTLKTITAELMAEQILETKTSAIIDLSVSEDIETGKDYVNTFLRRFFHLQTTARQPYLVIWEEAEDFAPESGAPGSRTCLEVAIAYARRGGKRGIGIIFVGHRPAWISKGILSQCPNKAIGRIESTDMKALEEYARIPRSIVEKLVPKTDEEGKVIYPGPTRGEFCFTGDWVEKTTFVKVGPVETTHLGSTPEIIPPSPKEITNVIDNLRKMLPSVIEKIKPAVVSKAELESKIKAELEAKYKNKIETILKTADEKAERKYKVRIDQLQEQLEKLSRSQALQPTAPVTDVLEHPIVKARMLQLDDKARDLLTWIEREPRHTREELAARMVSSKDVIASTVDKINRTFQLQVIVDDGGRPLRYKSMLKRLFLTDVAKREIQEIERLQKENRERGDKITSLEAKLRDHGTLVLDFERVKKELSKSDEQLGRALGENERLVQENEDLKILSKAGEALSSAVAMVTEKPLNTVKEEILAEVKKMGAAAPIGVSEGAPPMDEEKIEALIKQKIKELTPAVGVSTAEAPSEISVVAQQPTLLLKKQTPPLELMQESLDGRIAIVYAEGMLPEKAFTTGQLNQILETRFGTKEFPGNLAPVCIKFVSWGYFEKVHAGKRWDYRVRIPAEEARSKGLIRE